MNVTLHAARESGGSVAGGKIALHLGIPGELFPLVEPGEEFVLLGFGEMLDGVFDGVKGQQ